MTNNELPERAEIVVVGAGHNSLVCAAYLACAVWGQTREEMIAS